MVVRLEFHPRTDTSSGSSEPASSLNPKENIRFNRKRRAKGAMCRVNTQNSFEFEKRRVDLSASVRTTLFESTLRSDDFWSSTTSKPPSSLAVFTKRKTWYRYFNVRGIMFYTLKNSVTTVSFNTGTFPPCRAFSTRQPAR